MKDTSYYRVTFRDQEDRKNEKLITLRVKKITDSSLGLGFVAMSGFLFEHHSLLVDPAEEKLRQRYANTKTLHISLYGIIAIEEVGESNLGLHFDKDKANLYLFPRD